MNKKFINISSTEIRQLINEYNNINQKNIYKDISTNKTIRNIYYENLA